MVVRMAEATGMSTPVRPISTAIATRLVRAAIARSSASAISVSVLRAGLDRPRPRVFHSKTAIRSSRVRLPAAIRSPAANALRSSSSSTWAAASVGIISTGKRRTNWGSPGARRRRRDDRASMSVGISSMVSLRSAAAGGVLRLLARAPLRFQPAPARSRPSKNRHPARSADRLEAVFVALSRSEMPRNPRI